MDKIWDDFQIAIHHNDFNMYNSGNGYYSNHQLVAGVDEAGRGPLAGPVIAAAVIFDPKCTIEGLADSKVLSPKRRESLAITIQKNALSFAIGRAEVAEIDQLNILHASMLAMQRAVQGLAVQPGIAMIDGNRSPDLDCATQAVVKGDSKIPQISAASILAKVERDREMLLLHEQFPEYGFDQHKGYPTKFHRERLKSLGATVHHRRSFKPVASVLGL